MENVLRWKLLYRSTQDLRDIMATTLFASNGAPAPIHLGPGTRVLLTRAICHLQHVQAHGSAWGLAKL